jgi:hypothetical protein
MRHQRRRSRLNLPNIRPSVLGTRRQSAGGGEEQKTSVLAIRLRPPTGIWPSKREKVAAGEETDGRHERRSRMRSAETTALTSGTTAKGRIRRQAGRRGEEHANITPRPCFSGIINALAFRSACPLALRRRRPDRVAPRLGGRPVPPSSSLGRLALRRQAAADGGSAGSPRSRRLGFFSLLLLLVARFGRAQPTQAPRSPRVT